MACGGCGGRENPTEAPVVGPAVILGNGTTKPFSSDAALDRYIAWADIHRPGDERIVVLEGQSYP